MPIMHIIVDDAVDDDENGVGLLVGDERLTCILRLVLSLTDTVCLL